MMIEARTDGKGDGMVLVIVAGAAAAKVKIGSMIAAVVVAVRQSFVIGAEIGEAPVSGSDLLSLASRDGLALLIAVLFIGGVMTRRIIITDPKADSALLAVTTQLAALTTKLGEVSDAVRHNSAVAEGAVDRLDRLERSLANGRKT